MRNKEMKKKKLLFYEKGKFDEFIKQFPDGENMVYPVSYLTDQKIALKYTGIDGVDHFIIDITVMVMSALVRNDLRIIYESWINSLNEENEERIDYCVEKSLLQEACDVFYFYFESDAVYGYDASGTDPIWKYVGHCGASSKPISIPAPVTLVSPAANLCSFISVSYFLYSS